MSVVDRSAGSFQSALTTSGDSRTAPKGRLARARWWVDRIKNGGGRGTFISSVEEAVAAFYTEVIQQLKAWGPAPPRLQEPQPGLLH